jgi:hypothetical protein
MLAKLMAKVNNLQELHENKRGNSFFLLKGERWKRREGLDTKKQKSNKIRGTNATCATKMTRMRSFTQSGMDGSLEEV